MNMKELKYLDLELYSVETAPDGRKMVHIYGYCYWGEECYMCAEACSSFISVEDIEKCADESDVEVLLSKFFDNAKHYDGEVNEEEVVKYYSGAKELRISCVCANTPDGLYVNY